jgi:hypothetical protein
VFSWGNHTGARRPTTACPLRKSFSDATILLALFSPITPTIHESHLQRVIAIQSGTNTKTGRLIRLLRRKGGKLSAICVEKIGFSFSVST